MLRVAEHAERTDTGRQRRANEDAYHARSPLFAVADGMGGAQAGEVASATAVAALSGGLPGRRGHASSSGSRAPSRTPTSGSTRCRSPTRTAPGWARR